MSSRDDFEKRHSLLMLNMEYDENTSLYYIDNNFTNRTAIINKLWREWQASREQMKKECLDIMASHGGYDSIYAAIEALE